MRQYLHHRCSFLLQLVQILVTLFDLLVEGLLQPIRTWFSIFNCSKSIRCNPSASSSFFFKIF